MDSNLERQEIKELIDNNIVSPEVASHLENVDIEAHVTSIKINKPFISGTKTDHNVLGFAFALISGFIFALSNVFYKKASFFNGAEKSLSMYIILFVLITSLLLWQRQSFLATPQVRRDLCMRGFCGVVYVIIFQFSLTFIEPPDSIALSRTNIILVAIVSRLLFKEMLNFTHILAIISTIIGS